MNLADAEVPRRGGKDFLGSYVGGAALTQYYTLDTSVEAYQCAMQLCTEKSLLAIENGIRRMSDDSASLKFNGKLEIKKNENVIDELDKDKLLLKVDDLVHLYIEPMPKIDFN